MAVSNELQRPVSDDDFEAMCCLLYAKVWGVTGLMRVGRTGQAQFGVDILGHDGRQSVGIQCKLYTSTKFTLGTVTADIDEADKAGLQIKHLLFATTAPAKAETVRAVHELSERRRASGLFTVSVDFWSSICGHIRLHPEVGRAFIPAFPGGTLLAVEEKVEQVLAITETSAARQEALGQRILEAVADSAVSKATAVPDARGDESDPGVVASLDFVRDKLCEGKTADARNLLDKLGDPDNFKDQYSKFRWHTNAAAIAAAEQDEELAAEEFLKAFQFAPEDPKAHINRVHAYFVRKKFEAADVACEEALAKFPNNSALWGLSLHTRAAVGREEDIAPPPEVEESADFLFSKSRLLGKRGDNRGAIALLERCVELDGGSLDARRALLADALTWAAVDPVAAFMGQLPIEKRTALQKAVSLFEPLEQVLPSMQADRISEELATNITSSLTILQDKPRARRLAQQLLSRHPNLEQLLRIHVSDLAENEKIDDLRALTDGKLGQLPSSIIATLSEVSAQRGDIAWNDAVMAEAVLRYSDDEKLRSIEPFRFLARWRSGDRDGALHSIRRFISDGGDDVFARVLEAEFLKCMGRRDEAIAVAKIGRDKLLPGDISLNAVHIADLLFNLKEYDEALPILRRLVAIPGDNELTWKLAACLVSLDRRREAQRLLDALPAEVREQSSFRRIEINLTGRMGDWSRLRSLLEAELALDQKSPECVVGYADALFRLGDRDALAEFVAKDPVFDGATVEQDLAFAKLQMHCGFSDLGVLRLYRQFRAHPTSEKVAGHFLGQLMLARGLTVLVPPKVVGPATAVHLRRGDDAWVVAIDCEGMAPIDSWPELISTTSDLARILLGRSPGDEVVMRRGMFDETVQVVGIAPLMAFAAKKAQALIANSTSSDGPIWSVRIIKDDGDVDVDILLRSAQERRQQAEHVFQMYGQHRLPLCVLAKLMSIDPIKLLLEWPSHLVPLFVGVGSEEERQLAFSLINLGTRFVVDTITIAELVRHDALEAVRAIIGRPFVAQTQREQLIVILAAMDGRQESVNLGEENGRLRVTDVPSQYFDRRKKLLLAVLSFIDDQCDVVPTTGPEEVTEAHQSLSSVLDSSTLDNLYLCLEHKAALLSEDGGLRAVAIEAGVSLSTNVQPLLMVARDRGLITPTRYAEILSAKLLANHDFVSVTAFDLLAMALKTPDRVSPAAKAAFESFRRPSLQMESGIKVSGEFIRLAAKRLPPTTMARYCQLILDVLKHERPQLARLLIRYISRHVKHFFGRNGRRLKSYVRREFGRELLRRR